MFKAPIGEQIHCSFVLPVDIYACYDEPLELPGLSFVVIGSELIVER